MSIIYLAFSQVSLVRVIPTVLVCPGLRGISHIGVCVLKPAKSQANLKSWSPSCGGLIGKVLNNGLDDILVREIYSYFNN